MQIAIDFETYYDKEYSLKKMNTWSYVFDPRFNAYLVALHNDEIHIVDNPKNVNWSQFEGATFIMHNAGFDGVVMKKLFMDGIIPFDIKSEQLKDTADLAAYLKCKRDLKTAAKELLGVDMSKNMRDKMKGLTYEDAVAKGLKDKLLAYGGADAEHSWNLWKKYRIDWPENEQRVSHLSRKASWTGVPVNIELVKTADLKLKNVLFEAERDIPWAGNEKILSPGALRAHAREVGMLDVPASLDKRSKDADVWIEKYKVQYPWVLAISNWRSANTLYKKVNSLLNGIRADGTFSYPMKYCGAGTGRFSGGSEKDTGGKFNIQNLPREEMFGVDIRPMLIAPKGYKLVIIDLAQIEHRILLWRVGDLKTLELIQSGIHPYEAHARMYMGWNKGKLKNEDKKLYALSKARVLGLGYGCSGPKFVDVARIMAGVTLTIDEAKEQVSDFRLKNPLITRHWYRHHDFVFNSANSRDPEHRICLASGRVLKYFEPQLREERQIKARFALGKPHTNIYGGKIVENEIQATARDLLIYKWLELHDAGIPMAFTVHDEFAFFVKETEAKEKHDLACKIITTAPAWLEGCPLDVESKIVDVYEK